MGYLNVRKMCLLAIQNSWNLQLLNNKRKQACFGENLPIIGLVLTSKCHQEKLTRKWVHAFHVYFYSSNRKKSPNRDAKFKGEKPLKRATRDLLEISPQRFLFLKFAVHFDGRRSRPVTKKINNCTRCVWVCVHVFDQGVAQNGKSFKNLQPATDREEKARAFVKKESQT